MVLAGRSGALRMTPKAVIALVAATLAALIALEGSASAQYDRDGHMCPPPEAYRRIHMLARFRCIPVRRAVRESEAKPVQQMLISSGTRLD
jgi:hypothetical protein